MGLTLADMEPAMEYVKTELAKNCNVWKKWAYNSHIKKNRMYWSAFILVKVLVGTHRGLKFVPLYGKRPIIDNWQKSEFTIDQLLSTINDYITYKGIWKEKPWEVPRINKKGDPYIKYGGVKRGRYDPSSKSPTGFMGFNVGIRAGDSFIIVIDVDTKKGKKGLITLRKLCDEAGINMGDLQKTLGVPSGSGNGAIHYYFSLSGLPEDICEKFIAKYGEDVDIIRGNQQIVSPYSTHPSLEDIDGECGFYVPDVGVFGKNIFPLATFHFDLIDLIPYGIQELITKKEFLEKDANSRPQYTVKKDILPVEAIKEILDKFSKYFRQNHDGDIRRNIIWAILSLNSDSAALEILVREWIERMPNKVGVYTWGRLENILTDFDPTKAVLGLDYILKYAKYVNEKDIESTRKRDQKVFLQKKLNSINVWIEKWIPDRKVVKNFDLVYNEEFVRPLPETADTIMLQSSCGTGKSYATRKYLYNLQKKAYDQYKPFKMVYIVNRVSNGYNSTQMLREKLGKKVAFYKDNLKSLRSKDMLVIEIESLNKLLKYLEEIEDGSIDVVCIDEVESNLEQLNSSTVAKKWYGNTRVLELLMQKSKKAILCDAFLSERTEEFIKLTRSKEGLIRIKNKRLPIEKEVIRLESVEDIIANSKLKIHQGKNCGLVLQEKKVTEQVYEALINEFGEGSGIIYNATTNNKADLANVNELWKRYKFVIFNLTITVGVDFTEIHFDILFVYASNRHCGLPRDLIQAMMRIRFLRDNIIYLCIKDIPRTYHYGFTVDAIKANIKERNHKIIALNDQRNAGFITEEEFNEKINNDYDFGGKMGEFEQEGGVPLDLILNKKMPKYLKKLEVYHHLEAAQCAKSFTSTLDYYLELINCKYTDKEPETDGDDIKLNNKKKIDILPLDEVFDLDDRVEWYTNRISILGDREIDIMLKLGNKDLKRKDKHRLEVDLARLRRVINRRQIELKHYKDIMYGSSKEYVDLEEKLAVDKFQMFKIIRRDLSNIDDIWEEWVKKPAFRRAAYVTKEIVSTIGKYDKLKKLGTWTGSWEEYFSLQAFKKYDYVEHALSATKIFMRKWGMEVLSKLVHWDNDEKKSLFRRLSDGFVVGDEVRERVRDFIIKNEKDIRKELHLNIRKEGKVSSKDVNKVISFILSKVTGMRMTVARHTIKEKVLVYDEEKEEEVWKRKNKNVPYGYKVEFIVPVKWLR